MAGRVWSSPFGAVGRGGRGSLVQQLWAALEEHADSTALEDSASGETYSCRQLRESAERAARHLSALGLGPRQTLVLYSGNCLQFVVMVLAAWRLGASVALLNAMAQAADVRREVEKIGATLVFTSQANAASAAEGCRGTKVKTIITTGSAPGCVSFSLMVQPSAAIQLPSLQSLSVRSDDTLAILFSSGTTGLPKAVQLTDSSLQYQLLLADIPVLEMRQDTNLLFQPMAHIYGLALMAVSLYYGSRLIVVPAFTLEGYLQLVAKYRISLLTVVPPVAVALAKSGLLKKYDLSCVTSVLCAAAPLSAEMEQELCSQLGDDVTVRQGYGLTETSGAVCIVPGRSAADKCRPKFSGSVGVLLPGAEGKVVDPDTGKAQGPNGRGELLFRGPMLMKNYLNNPQATADTIDSEGWLHTGDIGFYDDNGCIYIVDRMKELIKYKAMQVAPSELEALLLTHPAVADVGVLGRPDTMAGELPMAWVVLKPGHSCREADIQDFVAERAAPYKKLRGGVTFVKMIPKSPSGKILRREMKRIMIEQLSKSKL